MANNYYFKIENVQAHVQKDGLQNVIYNVYYAFYAEDGNGNIAHQLGIVHLPSVDADNFTPVEDLTQSDIISWIEADLPVEEFKANLDMELAELAAPTKVTLQIPE
jgi:hypothetical protein